MPSIRCGLYLPPFGPLADPVALVELARRAEAAGWDGVFLWEHVLGAGPVAVADSWVALGAMAGATSRIRLGTMVSPLPRRRPWVLARQAGTVSRLSNGRCVLGVGLGADDYGDFSRFGDEQPLATRARMTDEALQVIDAVWAGKAAKFEGCHYTVDLPDGVAEPHRIPVWVAGRLPEVRAAHRAVRRDGVMLIGSSQEPEPELLAGAVEALRAHGLAKGRPFDVAVAGNASHAWEEPKNVNLAGLVEAGMTWWMESLIHYDPLELTLAVVDAGPPRW
ncbi:MAG TPA: LLM class flavin-dependent oxidoreductase [Pseudonocardiaceae bacterium]|jgi:alkanesulfonate monooxygenase SsuD/methylene tetrahydromethanopterin reductase-like flavin-dependent oxidoreductase (luciferase family)|nr:LLM class flavin-dependent oxidoreductase [Pseudonocardiaceae bacterium]